MDKLRLFILVIAVVVVIGFSIYTFGSYSVPPKPGVKINPVKNSASLSVSGNKTPKQKSQITSVVRVVAPPPMSIYENREKPENFYSIQFPSSSNVIHGNNSGSYVAKLSNDTFSSADLIDIPDNSTIPLYILTHIEPSLKSSQLDYHRLSYHQFMVGGHRAWDLTYTWKNANMQMETRKTFIEGSDEVAAITFSTPREQIGNNINSTIINPIINSFHWVGQ